MAGVKRRVLTGSDIRALHKELDEVSCPICMDHPHNAVLLLCSSHDKGCRSYICDTSYRHSNCLDRFKKLREDSGDGSVSSTPVRMQQGQEENNNEDSHSEMQESVTETRDSESSHDVENSTESKHNLNCPMCRGAVLGWEVVEEARNYLNLKRRSCSRESCSFSGCYQELRRHARRVHPTTRPSDVDPSREHAWRRLENQTEYGDIVSAIQSAMPGAVVVGDYVIENGDRLSVERDNGRGGGNGSSLWSTYFLFQMISSSIDGLPERRPHRSRAWTRHRRSAMGPLPERRFLWGENLLGLQDGHDNEDDYVLSDLGEDESPVPRRRRRLTRTRSDEDQP